MVCDLCCINPATILVQEIVDDTKKAVNLCAACADGKKLSVDLVNGFSVESSTTATSTPGTGISVSPGQEGRKCSSCGRSNEDVIKSGRLGCETCYDIFDDILDELLPQIQPGTSHCGKRFRDAATSVVNSGRNSIDGLSRELDRLKDSLGDAVNNEEFERAAKLHTMIRKQDDDLELFPDIEPDE